MRYTLFFAIVFCFSISSCELKLIPIEYNQDECSYCKMKISDIRFGAEMITKKGKVYKYDSAECLVRKYNEDLDQEYAYLAVTDFSRPETLVDATTASFLISINQSSPMGGNLSAYEKREKAESVLNEKGGKVLTFTELVNKYKVLYK